MIKVTPVEVTVGALMMELGGIPVEVISIIHVQPRLDDDYDCLLAALQDGVRCVAKLEGEVLNVDIGPKPGIRFCCDVEEGPRTAAVFTSLHKRLDGSHMLRILKPDWDDGKLCCLEHSQAQVVLVCDNAVVGKPLREGLMMDWIQMLANVAVGPPPPDDIWDKWMEHPDAPKSPGLPKLMRNLVADIRSQATQAN